MQGYLKAGWTDTYYDDDYGKDDTEYEPQEVWKEPFKNAVRSGMVDGGSATQGPTNNGAVSDQPTPDIRASGFNG